MADAGKKKPHVPAVRPEWLSLRQEAAVEPSLSIVDAHVHLWDFSTPPFFGADLVADASSGHDVTASVFIECMMAYAEDGQQELRPVGETRFVASQAQSASSDRHKVAAAIMGAADLALGDAVRPVLEAHVEAGGGRFRGIRTRAAWDADPVAGYGAAATAPEGLLRQTSFQQGVRCLGTMGLTLDVWLFHTQLADVVALAKACPEVPIAVNHVGGPLGVGRYAGQRDEVFATWLDRVRELARCPNIYIKLGGLGISRMGFGFDAVAEPLSSDELAQAWGPYLTSCIEAFGPQRSLFGSNFPVDKAVCSYTVLWNCFKKITAGYSESERLAMFASNARKLYRI